MITVTQAAQKLDITAGRVRQLIIEGRIKGAQKVGPIWLLPNNPVVAKPARPRGRPARS